MSANTFPADPRHAVRTTVRHFDCPACSARMVFTADGTRMHCEHCGYDEGLAQTDEKDVVQGESEQDFLVAMATATGHLKPETMQAFDCATCGHAFLLKADTLSVTCPYCDSVYVVEELAFSARQLIPPQAIVPFQVTLAMAEKRLKAWGQKQGVRLTEPRGVFMPAFTFDIGGALEWRGYVYNRDNQRIPKTGSFHLDVDDMLIPAIKKMPKHFATELQNFDLTGLVPYDPRYIASFPAEVYDFSVGDASIKARGKALKSVKNRIRDHADYQKATITSTNSTQMLVTSYKLILLPLWVSHYYDKGNQYDVLVNGQTGKTRGQLPLRTTLPAKEKGVWHSLKALFS